MQRNVAGSILIRDSALLVVGGARGCAAAEGLGPTLLWRCAVG
jgi:hypothetical protein